LLDAFANPDIGAAATDIARHRPVNVGIGRMRIVRDQGRRRHDLPRLAVTALWDLQIEPGFLDRLPGRGPAHGLDGCDRGRADGRFRQKSELAFIPEWSPATRLICAPG
jgi:hypothetical protein